MYRVTRLNPVSWAKIYTLASLIILSVFALLFVVPALLVTAMAGLASEDAQVLLVGIPFGIIAVLIGLLGLGVMIFLISLLQGVAFNWALGRTGGLEIDLGLGPGYVAPEAAAAAAAVAAPPAAAALTADEPAPAPALEAAPEAVAAAAVATEAAERADDAAEVVDGGMAASPGEAGFASPEAEPHEDLPPGGA
jgi:hypothetical protein